MTVLTDTTEVSPLVLAGAGPAHLVVLRRWLVSGYKPPAGTLLINPHASAWYSGMMPGLIAGRYHVSQCVIELLPLCRALGIRLITDELRALDTRHRVLTLAKAGPVYWQCLSLNTGSVPAAPAKNDDSIDVVPAKPFPVLHQRCLHWRDHMPPARLAVLGGGAAAFELALAFRRSLADTRIGLISATGLLHGQPHGLAERARQLLQARDVSVFENTFITGIHQGHVLAEQRPVWQLDALVLATAAAALPWYRDSGLSCDDTGFIRARATLQSESDPAVFVAGDIASLAGSKKSGVYSVRHGAVLAGNLRAWLEDGELKAYKPQKRALALMATADGGALVHYAGWTLGGRPIGVWKHWLDQGFMRRHQLSD